MAKPEVAQPFDDPFAAMALGQIDALQPRQCRQQIGLGIAHHHPGEACFEHGQVIETVASGDHPIRLDGQHIKQCQQGGAFVDSCRQHIEVLVIGKHAIHSVLLDLGNEAVIKTFGVVVVGQAALGADRLGGQTLDPIEEFAQGLMFAFPALLDRIHRQRQQLEAGPAGDAAAHIANHEMGSPQAQTLILNQ